MKTKHTDENYSIRGRARNRIARTDSEVGSYDEGAVVTPHGIVWAYAQGERTNPNGCFSILEMAANQRLYTRRFKIRLTARALVTKARRFAWQVMNAHANGLDQGQLTPVATTGAVRVLQAVINENDRWASPYPEHVTDKLKAIQGKTGKAFSPNLSLTNNASNQRLNAEMVRGKGKRARPLPTPADPL